MTKLKSKWMESPASSQEQQYPSSFTKEIFDLSSPTTTIQLTTGLDNSQYIEVYVGGIEYREGSSWVRDAINGRILLHDLTPADTWVKVKKWQQSTTTDFVKEEFDVSSPVTEVQLVTTINSSRTIEVFVGGVEYREVYAWTRDLVNNRILFIDPTPSDTWVKVRIYATPVS